MRCASVKTFKTQTKYLQIKYFEEVWVERGYYDSSRDTLNPHLVQLWNGRGDNFHKKYHKVVPENHAGVIFLMSTNIENR